MAEVNIIAKNNTQSGIILYDMYKYTLDATAEIDLTSMFPTGVVLNSLDLKDAVTAGDVTINDGTEDLNITDALDHLSAITRFKSTQVSEQLVQESAILVKANGVPIIDQLAVLNFTGNVNLLEDSTSDVTINVSSSGVATAFGISFTMSDHASHDYVANGNSTYLALRSFVFDGTDLWTPQTLSIIASKSSQPATGYARIYDFTNNNEIVEVFWSTSSKDIYISSALENLPTGPAIFELQTRSSQNGREIRTHYMALY